jgi:sec-independent protein translocase protein TatA
MGGLSVWHWLIFLVVALLLFGGSGKISSIMGDVAKGIKSFKKGMTEEDDPAQPASDPFKKDEPRAIDNAAVKPATTPTPAQTPHVNKAG